MENHRFGNSTKTLYVNSILNKIELTLAMSLI